MTEVIPREGEPFQRTLKRFRRRVEQSGILKEARHRAYYLKPSERKRVKRRAAAKRRRRAASRARKHQ